MDDLLGGVTPGDRTEALGFLSDIKKQGEVRMEESVIVDSQRGCGAQGKSGAWRTATSSEEVVVQRLISLGESPSPQIAAAQRAVERDIVDLGQRCLWKPCYGGLVFPPRLDSLHRVQSDPAGVEVLYAIYRGHVVGFLVLHLGSAINRDYAGDTVACLERLESPVPAFVRSLGVAPEVRGKGIGQALLRKALKRAARAGASLLAGHVKCRPDSDHRLITAFSRAGFVESPGRVSVTVMQNKDDGTFTELEGPYGGAQVPQVFALEYVVWIAPTRGHLLVGQGREMRVCKRSRHDQEAASAVAS